jgi:hypothetical protein
VGSCPAEIKLFAAFASYQRHSLMYGSPDLLVAVVLLLRWKKAYGFLFQNKKPRRTGAFQSLDQAE